MTAAVTAARRVNCGAALGGPYCAAAPLAILCLTVALGIVFHALGRRA